MLLSYMPTYLTDELSYDETHGLLILLGTMVVLMVRHQPGRHASPTASAASRC